MIDITARKVNIRKEVDMRNKIAQKGFTLIELLIVIVIIGVLAGIVIVILNPAVQRNRARDSVLLASINKIGAEAQAYANSDITGVGTYPTCAQIVGTTAGTCTNGTLKNILTCPCGAGTQFTISGVTTGTQGFRYVPNGVIGFCISAQANNPPDTTNTYMKYNYPGDAAPSYQTTAC